MDEKNQPIKTCKTWEFVYGEIIPECEHCKHYGCEAFRYLKQEDDRNE